MKQLTTIMNFNMAFFANRLNVKPVFFGITFVMMIFFCCGFAKSAFKSMDRRYFSRFNQWLNSIICSVSFNMRSVILPSSNTRTFPTFFSFFILFLVCCCFWSMPIFFGILFALFCYAKFSLIFSLVLSVTILARGLPTIKGFLVFKKFRQRLNFLASTTSFCFNTLRHGFSPLKSCLEPNMRPILVSGSSYCSISLGGGN